MNREIKTLSLFSGAGGLDIGFHNAGYDIVGCVEIEKQYCDTLIANQKRGIYFSKDAQILCQDIRDFDATQFADMGIECVIGGPPCQPFSAAGRRAGGVPGIQDERGMLFESYCKVLSIIRPKVFIFENVYGLKGANGGEPWKEILTSFSALGYSIKAEILDAADYGVAQHRERLILVGTLEKEFNFPEPTNGPDSRSGKDLVSIWEVVKDLPEENETSEDLGGMYGHLLPLVPEGLNYSFFTKEMGYPEPYFAWRSKFHDFLYKADRNKPSRTLKAQPGKFTGPFHWNNRHFTVNELKRIQSFPDDYVISGTSTQMIAQIGNSVPPRLAEVLAVCVKEQILRETPCQSYPLRPDGFVSTFRKRQRLTSEYYKKVAIKEIEKRFGSQKNPNDTIPFSQNRHYYIGYTSRYISELMEQKPLKKTMYNFCYKVTSDTLNEVMDIKVINSSNKKIIPLQIQISGLKKYLLKIDSVSVHARIAESEEIFNIWDVVQKELVDMSQFYSLIDIYGHYANRGDTVKITTLCGEHESSKFVKAINFFGVSEHCGIYLSRSELANNLGVEESDIDVIIEGMRAMRYDVRVSATHPTIRTDEVICTYPFPMLSEKAMFDKRVKNKLREGITNGQNCSCDL